MKGTQTYVNFGWPRPSPIQLKCDVEQSLSSLLEAIERTPQTEPIGLQVTGPGGGQWELYTKDGSAVAARPGISPTCTCQFHLNSRTFRRLRTHELSVSETLRTAETVIEGNSAAQPQMVGILEQIVESGAN